MKRILIAAILLASLSVNAQTKEPKVDSSDIPIISIKDLEETLKEYGDRVSHNTFMIMQQAFQQVLTDAIKRKQQPKPKK